RPRLAPMVNAVLRRWLRERETLIAELDADPITHHALPEWLVRAISEDWPGQAESVFAANNIEPPLTIRVNRRRSPRETLATAFANAGYGSEPHAWLPDALMLERSTDITRLPGFNEVCSRCRTVRPRRPPSCSTSPTASACSTPARRRAARPATCSSAPMSR